MNIIDRDKQFIWHPFTPQKNMAEPLAIIKAKGSVLYDENDKEYIDAISSWWVNVHGHAHPYIAEKIYAQALQLEHIIFAGFTHQPAVNLAERLIEILPAGFSKIFYSDDGSTAVEVAIKMALQYWWNQDNETKKTKIIAFTNSYHGDTFGAMSASERSVFTKAFHNLLFDVIFVDVPTNGNLSSIKNIITTNAENIAAFIYEPLVQGAGGMKMYNPVLLDELLLFIKEQNIICIADEVMTGFGRTGKMFASEYMQTKPDIICMSKGLTGGTMALGATTCTQNIYDVFVEEDAMKTFFHGHSFTANPLACTAALASLDLFEKENSIQKTAWIAERSIAFAQQLRQLNGIKNVRSTGTILAFEIDAGKDEYLNNISQTVTAKALERGVYLRPLGNTVYTMPPYCITEEELQKMFSVVLEVI